MGQQGVSGRELGRRLRPDAPESGRRMVQEYLAGRALPRRKRRREIAAALGLPDDAFEESDPVAARLSLIEDLMAEVRELTALREERVSA